MQPLNLDFRPFRTWTEQQHETNPKRLFWISFILNDSRRFSQIGGYRGTLKHTVTYFCRPSSLMGDFEQLWQESGPVESLQWEIRSNKSYSFMDYHIILQLMKSYPPDKLSTSAWEQIMANGSVLFTCSKQPMGSCFLVNSLVRSSTCVSTKF